MASGGFHTDTLTDLPQMAQVVIACCDELGDMLLHGQLIAPRSCMTVVGLTISELTHND